nr:hypothetical protein [uncultured Eisenbergiella sp.]
MDAIAIIAAFVFCFLTMYYADVTVTARFSFTFLDSLFDGKPISFYANALATGIAPEGAVYDIGMYVAFAVWNIPVWILNKLFQIDLLSIGCLLWYKLMLVFIMFVSINIMKKIGEVIGYDDTTLKLVSIIYLLSFTVFFPVLVAVQYDIIPLTFILYGLLCYLRGDKRKFILCFALSMTMKPFALFAFIALVLMTEKKIRKIILYNFCGVSLMLCCKILYSFSKGYRASGGDFFSGMLPVLFANSIPVGNAELSLFIFALFLIYIAAYDWKAGMDPQENTGRIILIVTFVWAAFSVFVGIPPYWLVYLSPFLTLSLFMNPGKVNFCLILDWIYNSTITVIMIMQYPWVYGGGKTFQYLLFKPFYLNYMEGKEGVTVAGILRRLYIEDLLPIFSAVQAAAILAILFMAWRKNDEERQKVGIWHVRVRVCMLYGWIALSLGAFALGILGY